MKVKICGIRTPEEALHVAQFHPDAIGILVGFGSIAPNEVSVEQAEKIVKTTQTLSFPLDTFLLTKANDPETNIQYINNIHPSHIQLTGDISPEDTKKVKEYSSKTKVVKVIHVIDEQSINFAKKYTDVDALLLDSRIENKTGGTGKIHDWTISQKIIKEINLPIWLAGGLTINNVENAISQVNPYGVDVETGVQNPDGSKNFELIQKFIQLAKKSPKK